jgi:5,10-methylene-tetrahydrofolate dehydrogenase/methenyl tetrahydrofolate cyclohydrolase
VTVGLVSVVACFANLPLVSSSFIPLPLPKVGSYSTFSIATMSAAATATDIDGNAIAKRIRQELQAEIQTLPQQPGLAVILVGERRDSQTYVSMKKKACVECGIASFGYDFPATATQQQIMDCVLSLNEDPRVHGILVQLPLPPHIQEHTVLEAIDPRKDVDGLHSHNVASLSSTATHAGSKEPLDWTKLETIPFAIPCTPQGCIELLDRTGVSIEGKRAVVLGRSNLVGIPVALLLMHRNATVTVVHSRTVNTPAVVAEADIVIAAVGKANLVKSTWLKPGAVVIDVGINSVDCPTAKRGYRLVGDVDYQDCRQVASLITPVPGGVGPMTIAMLMRNTVSACKRTLADAGTDDTATITAVAQEEKKDQD